jgi:hypothetical protein
MELHSQISNRGWEIHVEMTNRTRNGKVIKYAFKKHIEPDLNVEVILLYPNEDGLSSFEIVISENGEQKNREPVKYEDDALWKTADVCFRYSST